MRTLLTPWALALALPQALAQQACAPVNIIVARGSTEQPGVGLMGSISSAAAQQIPGAVVTPLDYPAQLNPYPPSVAAGVVSMTDLLTQQTAACPQTRLVVMGYSQGAHVALDTLCGSSLNGFTPSAAQASAVGASSTWPTLPLRSSRSRCFGCVVNCADSVAVAAVILAGDPTFVPGLPSNRGTSQDAGVRLPIPPPSPWPFRIT